MAAHCCVQFDGVDRLLELFAVEVTKEQRDGNRNEHGGQKPESYGERGDHVPYQLGALNAQGEGLEPAGRHGGVDQEADEGQNDGDEDPEPAVGNAHRARLRSGQTPLSAIRRSATSAGLVMNGECPPGSSCGSTPRRSRAACRHNAGESVASSAITM